MSFASSLPSLPLTLTILASLTSCTSDPHHLEGRSDSIKIGLIAPISGEASSYGEQAKVAAGLALDAIQNKHPEKKFELFISDGKCDSLGGHSAMDELVRDVNVNAVLGGICSSETIGASGTAEQSHTVLLSPSSNLPAISNLGEYVYRTSPSKEVTDQALSEYLNSEKRWQAFFWSKGLDVRAPFNLSKETALIVDGSDLGFLEHSLALSTQANYGGIFILDLPVHEKTAQDFMAKYSHVLEGTIGASFPLNTSCQEPISCQTYDAMLILATAIAKSRDEGISIKETLDTGQTYETSYGMFHFDSNGDPIYENYLYRIEGGKIVSFKPND